MMHLPDIPVMLRQLRFIALVEAQRYLIFVVLGFIAWAWWLRRAGTNNRLQSRPIARGQLTREAFYWTHRLMHHRALFRFVHRTHPIMKRKCGQEPLRRARASHLIP
jgi:hypothetical protein